MLYLVDIAAQTTLTDWVVRLLLNAVGIYLAEKLLRGVELKDFGSAVIVALILAILNATVGWLLKILTFPLTLLTLGLFTLVVNAIVLLIADYFIAGFRIRGFGWALLLAVVLAVYNALIHLII